MTTALKQLHETNPHAAQAEREMGRAEEGYESAKANAPTEALLAVAWELRALRRELASSSTEVTGAIFRLSDLLDRRMGA